MSIQDRNDYFSSLSQITLGRTESPHNENGALTPLQKSGGLDPTPTQGTGLPDPRVGQNTVIIEVKQIYRTTGLMRHFPCSFDKTCKASFNTLNNFRELIFNTLCEDLSYSSGNFPFAILSFAFTEGVCHYKELDIIATIFLSLYAASHSFFQESTLEFPLVICSVLFGANFSLMEQALLQSFS